MNKKAFKPFVVGFLMALVAIVVIAASPSFQSFNTNQFYVNASGNVVAVKSDALLTNIAVVGQLSSSGPFSAYSIRSTNGAELGLFPGWAAINSDGSASFVTGVNWDSAGNFTAPTITGNGTGLTGIIRASSATNDATGSLITSTYIKTSSGRGTNSYLISPVSTNASIIGAVITPTNFFTPMFGVSCVSGTHTVTTTNASFTWHKGDDIAIVGIGQFRVTDVARLTNLTVDIINGGSTVTLTTNWAYYPVGMRSVDINGTLEAAFQAANDGSPGIIGRIGGNSARLQWFGDSNQVWTAQLRANGDWQLSTAQQEGNQINGAGDPNIIWIARTAPYESIHVMPDGSVSQRVGSTNAQDRYFFMLAPTSFRQGLVSSNAVFTNTITAGGVASSGTLTPVAVVVGASAFNFTNTTPNNLEVYLTDTAAFSVTKHGVQIGASLTSDAYFVLQPTNYCTITYASTTPTMLTNQW